MGQGPIFVVGVPRSGTTMLRYMLCSHPGIYIPPESNFIPRFFGRQPTASLSREEALRILAALGEYRTFWRDWQEGPLRPEELVDAVPELTPRALLGALYRRYAQQYGAERWGDKSPFYVSHVDVLARIFPDARVVHIIRDGRDVTASSLEAYRGRRYFYMDPYYHALSWRRRVREGMAAGRRLPPGRYHELRYERLTADPAGCLQEICEFLEEEYDPAMATPAREAAKHHHSSGIHRGARTPVTTKSTGRWRNVLSPVDQRLVQQVAGPLLAELGYELGDVGQPDRREALRRVALSAKYATTATGRGVLQRAGLFHPTRLLEALGTRGRSAPPAHA